MTGFFNAHAHLAILYCCFFNGFLICHFWYKKQPTLFKDIEAKLVFAFLISILINAILLLGLEISGNSLSNIRCVLPIISACLLIAHLIFHLRNKHTGFFTALLNKSDTYRLLFYFAIFIIVLLNGGLIEKITDAWWHMSLINKMGGNDSLNSNIPHLNGVSSRYYPPLWHANILTISKISSTSIPSVWNAFTPWGALIKVTSFYLLAVAITKDKKISFISVILFTLLPGIGNSHLRVSTWPSHISYIAIFTCVYLGFHLMKQPIKPSNIKSVLSSLIRTNYISLSLLICSLLIVFYSHKSELLWLTIAFMAYGIGISIYHIFQNSNVEVVVWDKLIRYVSALVFATTFLFSIYFYTSKTSLNSTDLTVFIYTSICFIFIISLILTSLSKNRKTSRALVTMFVIILIVGIDFKHLISLFLPEFAYPSDKPWQYPVLNNWFFDTTLQLPNWNFFKAGLLYSGAFSVIGSIFLVIVKANRASIFLASSATLSFFVLISPWYHWLSTLLNYHSVWRIAILIFHPIILILLLKVLWTLMSKTTRKLQYLALSLTLLLITINGAYESWNIHLNPKIVSDKKQSGSALKNWNIYSHRKDVINNSSLRYELSFQSMKALIEPNSYMYADLSTSYYAATYLPVFVKNVHAHQGLNSFSRFKNLKYDKECYSNTEEWNEKIIKYLDFSRSRLNTQPTSNKRYLLVNHDKLNSQLHRSCFLRSLDIKAQSDKRLTKKLYSDNLFTLYQLK